MDPQTSANPVATEPVATATPYRRIGLLGAGAAAIVAVGMLVAAATAAPNGIFAADSTAGSGALTGSVADHGGFGRGGQGGRITITAINGNDISLETVDGWTRTITVDDGTTYSQSGEDITLGDLEVGDTIRFAQTLEDDGTWTIDAIAVVLPRVGGEVTAIDGSTITVEGRDGSTATVTVSSSTTFVINGDDGTLSDIEVGMVLVAQGELTGDNALAATAVRAADADAFDGFGPRFGPGRGHGPGFFGPGTDNGDGSTPDATDDSGTSSDSAG